MTDGTKTITTKVWYKSKVLWVNIIALIALMAQMAYGFVIAPEEQAAIIIVINLILRAATGSGLTLFSQ